MAPGTARIIGTVGNAADTMLVQVRQGFSFDLATTRMTPEITAGAKALALPAARVTKSGGTGQERLAIRGIEYQPAAGSWLHAELDAAELALRGGEGLSSLAAGKYAAVVSVEGGETVRTVTVELTVLPAAPPPSAPPAAAATPPVAATTSQEDPKEGISTLLTSFAAAINSRDAGGIRRAYPTISSRTLDGLVDAVKRGGKYRVALATDLADGSELGTKTGEALFTISGKGAGGGPAKLVFAKVEGRWVISSMTAVK